MNRLRDFVQAFTRLVEQDLTEDVLLEHGSLFLSRLIAHDDWLGDAYSMPCPERYQQYLLHCDPLERFSVVSFVWAPGQSTPVHNHGVWGVVGVLRGAEISTPYHSTPAGSLAPGSPRRLERCQLERISTAVGDIHKVENARADGPSISIHLYGANIGAVRRSTYLAETGEQKRFISGYSNAATPNLWDRSEDTPS